MLTRLCDAHFTAQHSCCCCGWAGTTTGPTAATFYVAMCSTHVNQARTQRGQPEHQPLCTLEGRHAQRPEACTALHMYSTSTTAHATARHRRRHTTAGSKLCLLTATSFKRHRGLAWPELINIEWQTCRGSKCRALHSGVSLLWEDASKCKGYTQRRLPSHSARAVGVMALTRTGCKARSIRPGGTHC